MNRRALLGALLAVPTIATAALAEPTKTLDSLALADGWLGERATRAQLRGKVVLVDVFTFECINCVRVTPTLKSLYLAYPRSEFEIVAVHTPEVPSYQSRLAYLSQQKRAASLPWPIAIDNRYRIWNAYGVDAWPTQLVFDCAGVLRHTIVGDREDAALRDSVARLLGNGRSA